MKLVAILSARFFAQRHIGYHAETEIQSLRQNPYLDLHGRPTHPRELVDHNCINQRHETRGRLCAWEFEKDGKEVNVSVKGQLTFNTSHAMMEPVLSGLGVGFVPNSIADPYVETGELEIVLDDWSPFFDGYFLYYPTSRQHLPIFKTILDALRH